MEQAPVAVSSLDPMAQGHPVLPPYGSGLGRERAVFPRYYRSRPSLFLPEKLQLPINCRNARGGCADFGHSCSWVAKPRCSLYELIAAVAWRTAGMIGAVLKVRSLSALVRGVGS